MFKIFKVNAYTFRGSDSAIFIFASLFKGWQLLKERIFSYRRRFFPLRVDLLSDRFHDPGKQKGSHNSCFLVKMAKRHGVVPIVILILEVLIRTAADDIHKYLSIVFQRK